MGFFRNPFGRKPGPAKEKIAPPGAPIDPAKNKDLIRVYDAYGREMYISRAEWHDKVLVGSLKKEWDKPDELFALVLSALNDGFRSVVIEAAEHLYKIDHDRPRATCLWGIVLKEENRLDDAEKVFRDYLAEHGDNGSVLTNLAKVFAQRKEQAKADEILWRALKADPNQDNGLNWYRAIQNERHGKEEDQKALERVAALPGSWRAQLWLARACLDSKNLEGALARYHEALAHAGAPVPGDLLIQMSGDLGRHGYLREALEFAEPRFDVKVHGLVVGNNLLKAHVDLGHLDEARQILERLYECKRPDWQKTLSFWETEITKAGLEAIKTEAIGAPKCGMTSIVNPVWLPVGSPAAELFPEKAQDEFVICFLGSSAATGEAGQEAHHQMSDASGRLSRALPLFLSEQVYFATRARVQTVIPFVKEPNAAFVLSAVGWRDQDAVLQAQRATPSGDYVVVTHLVTQNEPWTIHARLLRVADAECLETLTATTSAKAPGDEIVAFAKRLLETLSQKAGLRTYAVPSLYRLPPAEGLSTYLLRLEQLLAVRLATLDEVSGSFLNGPREIIDGDIQFCLSHPANIITRILLAQTIKSMRWSRPEVVSEFAEKLALLQKQKPLAEPAQRIVDCILAQQPE